MRTLAAVILLFTAPLFSQVGGNGTAFSPLNPAVVLNYIIKI
jgi:hypothetical protein